MGPGGWFGTCSCQLCTNSATSSVSFPVGRTRMTTGGGKCTGGSEGRQVEQRRCPEGAKELRSPVS